MRYILITGVSSGIGYDLTRYLIAQSFFVIGTIRSKADKIRLENDFTDHFRAVILDVTDVDSIQASYQEVLEALDGQSLFGIVNNAGIAVSGPLVELSLADFQKQQSVNVNGVFNITNQFYPLLQSKTGNLKDAGRIINLSSIAGLLNTPFLGAYCVSKHAVESLSDIYRRELDIYGIKVIIFEPGPIKSQIWGKTLESVADYQSSDYAPYLSRMNRMVEKIEENALDTEVLSRLIYRALIVKKPRLRYIVDRQKRMIYLIHHLLPARWMDILTRKRLKKMKSIHEYNLRKKDQVLKKED